MKPLSSYLPIWSQLSDKQRRLLEEQSFIRNVSRGTLLRQGGADCQGLFIVDSGQLRTYIISEAGKEVTLFRLFEHDLCLFSASCMLPDLQFAVWIEAATDCQLWVVPVALYQQLSEQSPVVANFTNQLLASRFSEVMWLVEQILFKSMDARIAGFLLAERAICGGDQLDVTHDEIARHLGTAREVVTRLLKYLQREGLVKLARGQIELLDVKKLSALT